MLFSACPHLHVCLHFLWFYVTAGVKICDHLQYKLAQGSHVFPIKIIYLAREAYAPIFAAIFTPIFTTSTS